MSVPSSELGPPSPPPQASVSPSLDPKGGGGQHSLAGEGVGGPNSEHWTESLALCALKSWQYNKAKASPQILLYADKLSQHILPDYLGPEASVSRLDDLLVEGDSGEGLLEVALVGVTHHRSLHVEGQHHSQRHSRDSFFLHTFAYNKPVFLLLRTAQAS
jgi:hypothetical protein